MPEVHLATSDGKIQDCFTVLKTLRLHLDQGAFLRSVKAMQVEGYQLAYIDSSMGVIAVAGFRISHNLFMGKNLYVDDLITLESERSKGHGENLLAFLRKLALEEGCSTLHLDSGTHRGEAHKFYFKQGLRIASYHFSEAL